jgi:phosphatidylserine decarboxylase precursor
MGLLVACRQRLLVPAIVLSLSILSSAAAIAGPEKAHHTPVVEDLVTLLETSPPVREALEGAIRNAGLPGLESTEAFLAHLDDLVTAVPSQPETGPKALKYFYIINQAPEDRLNRDESFNAWRKNYAKALGHFMDTPASAAGIASYAALPNYHIDDYVVAPSGWLTFNQFFAREIKPGKRPIAAPCDDKVIVSPADSVFAGAWDIGADSKVTVKGVTWPIAKLLDGSPYRDAFKNGIYTHSFLNIDDYHRYHVPVAGEIREVRKIEGRVYMNVIRKADGSLQIIDGDTYQYNQERGLIVIDSPDVGLVAVLPIGMGNVSSVNLTPAVDDRLRKGDEFGFFMFGGSDIVMLFQSKRVVIDARVGTKYLQGQRIGGVR